MYMQLNSKPRKIFAVIWAWFEVFLFSGIFYGWGSLVFMLKEDNIYQNLCIQKTIVQDGYQGPVAVHNYTDHNVTNAVTIESPDVELDCNPQDKTYNLGFSIVSGLWPFVYGIIGQLGHRFGTRFIRLTCIVLFIIGSLLVAFTTPAIPWLAFVGECLFGVAGCGVLFTNLQLSYVFKRGRSIVCGTMTGACDSSIATVLYIKLAYDGGISRQACYIFLACIHLFALVSTFGWLPKMYIDDPESEIEIVLEEEGVVINKLLEKTKMTSENGDPLGSSISLNGSSLHIHVPKPNFHGSQILPAPEADMTVQQTVDRVDVENDPTTLLGHVFSATFLLHVVWYSVLQLRFVYFLGTLNPWIESVSGSPEEVSKYTNVSMYCMMAGIVTSITAGTFFDCQKQYFKDCKCLIRRQLAPLVLPLSAGTILGIGVSILQMIPSKFAVYASFVTLTAFRSFLYAIGNGYLSVMFPSKYFSSLAGLLMVLTGSFNFLQYGIFTWKTSYPGASSHVDIFILCLVVVSLVHPAYQFLRCYQAKSLKRPTKSDDIQKIKMEEHC